LLLFGSWVIAPGVAGLKRRHCRQRRRTDHTRGARRPALDPLRLRLPGGRRDPVDRDDRRDRLDLARAGRGRATSRSRRAGAQPRPVVEVVKVPIGAGQETEAMPVGLALSDGRPILSRWDLRIFLNRKNVIIIRCRSS